MSYSISWLGSLNIQLLNRTPFIDPLALLMVTLGAELTHHPSGIDSHFLERAKSVWKGPFGFLPKNYYAIIFLIFHDLELEEVMASYGPAVVGWHLCEIDISAIMPQMSSSIHIQQPLKLYASRTCASRGKMLTMLSIKSFVNIC